jgi:hypothetical protein
MAHKFQVTTVESERGWGQKRETALFDTFEEAKTYRDRINSFNNPPEKSVPDWYMIAENEIRVVEV